MRLVPQLVAASFAALVSLSASLARADGAFLTIKDGGSVVGKRVALASFSAETQNSGSPSSGAGTGKVATSFATFEIDGADNLGPDFQLSLGGAALRSALVEFTTPDAQGREQVSSTATFDHVTFTTCGLTLDGNGFGANYAISYGAVDYKTTAAAGGSPLAVRALSAPLPVVRRVTAARRLFPVLGAQPTPQVNGVTITLVRPNGGLPATPIKTIALSIQQPLSIGSQSSGAGAGKIVFNPFLITQERAGTPELQQAAANRQTYQSGTLSFTHAADGKIATVFEINVRQVMVKSDQVALAGGSTTETTTFEYGGFEIRTNSN